MKSKSQKVADQGANEPLESTKFFAITEVAEMVGVSTRSVRRWIKRDELAAHLSFPKIPSDLNWHDEVESLHRQGRCLRSFMHSGCLSSIYSSRVVGLKPRTSFSVNS